MLYAGEHLRGADFARSDAAVRAWSADLLRCLNVEVAAGGLDASGPVPASGRLLVSNHRSMLDVLVLLSRFGGHMLSKNDLAGWPVVRDLAAIAGTLYVDRSAKASGAVAIRQVAERLGQGRVVTVFPEGTTFPDDEVRPFHAGAFLAAIRGGAEVLPVGLAYREPVATYFQEPLGVHGRRVFSAPSIRVALHVGAPMPSKDRTTKRLAAEAHDAVQDLVTAARGSL